MTTSTIHSLPPASVEAVNNNGSGVSWGAILAGAFAAAALSFILVMLGFGLGFSSISPWSGEGVSAKTIGYSTAGWLLFTQIAASAIGGFLAGRLRVKWAGLHTREVYFRDTAHGLLAWAVASLATAALLGSAVGSVISGGAKTVGAAGGALGTGAAATAAAVGSEGAQQAGNLADRASGYFIDAMFRTPTAGGSNSTNSSAAPAAPVTPAAGSDAATGAAAASAPAAPLAASTPADGRELSSAQRMEVARVFAYSLANQQLADGDKRYLGQLVARHTGMSQADAEKRVGDTFAAYQRNLEQAATKAKEAADAARKAAAYASLWMFLALLCGAFIASLLATYGGRLRDRNELYAEPVLRHEVHEHRAGGPEHQL
ncbi:hypothetical protein G5B88_22840 [Herbaspirillum seropedicae]|uniref:Outer membrane protein n=1 Tax=Herbaspirillum seropedicae (strain SmR1) TaxID=757424 RepID=D8IWT3_HERSS|nr:hypothetical protein [Herbaspirillum seropedicae]ADJ65970.1 outer membrane protein [Herbaspirillum seropedicae SmR1]AKN67749.1 membrane protein [Herbaspirillum seropedicae]NQE29787.1 membrane protein [Herbaspirillum seropedicae]UMU23773.1 hypothetical protein G5B88_22840 [Herbaspirillum seropedicae]